MKLKKRILLGIGLAGCFAGGLPARALPFNTNPSSFAAYLNAKQGWNDGKKRYFSNLADCRVTVVDQAYTCWAGYVKVVSPMGTQFCELQSYNQYGAKLEWVRGDVRHGPTYPCQNR